MGPTMQTLERRVKERAVLQLPRSALQYAASGRISFGLCSHPDMVIPHQGVHRLLKWGSALVASQNKVER